MASNRSDQSRRNGAQSRGPITQEGKTRSSRNSFKTGLHASTVDAFPEPDRVHYEKILAEYRTLYNPADAVEEDLIEQLAFNRLRYHRFARLETLAFERALEADAFSTPREAADPDQRALDHLQRQGPLFDGLRRAINSLERNYLRTLKALEDRQRDLNHGLKAAPSRITVSWVDPETLNEKSENEPAAAARAAAPVLRIVETGPAPLRLTRETRIPVPWSCSQPEPGIPPCWPSPGAIPSQTPPYLSGVMKVR
jgi:hypothetical protein